LRKPPPIRTNGYVTFGCFNNLAKVTPRVIATWCAILHRVPNARMVLKTQQFSDGPTADGYGLVSPHMASDQRGSSSAADRAPRRIEPSCLPGSIQ
jgi:hypothetical protein